MSREEAMTDERLDSLERFEFESGPEHRSHHEWIAAWIAREKRKEERWEEIKTKSWGWAVVSLLGAIGTGAWNGAMWLKEHLK